MEKKRLKYKNGNYDYDKFNETIKSRSNEDRLVISNKIKLTKELKYGDPNFNNRNSAEATCFDKYEVRHHFQNNEIYKKCFHKIHLDGYTFDSNWEVEYYKYLLKNNKSFVVHPKGIPYEYDGKIYMYLPDFEVEGRLVEIKGNHLYEKLLIENTRDNAKYKCMLNNNVLILKGDDLIKLGLNICI